MAAWAVSAALLLAACRATPAELDSCSGDLNGVWREEADPSRAYHIVDRGRRVEVYPLFRLDLSGGRSPPRTELMRTGDHLEGKSELRVADGDLRCSVTTRARLQLCRGRKARLSVDWRPELDGCTPRGNPSRGVAIQRD